MRIGGQRGVLVVVEQPIDGPLGLTAGVAGDQAPGILTDQVMHLVPAGNGFLQHSVAVEAIELRGGLARRQASQGSGGKGVDLGAGMQAQVAEESLPPRVQVLIGGLEGGGHRPVLGGDRQQPGPSLADQVGHGPGPVPGKEAGQERDRQRQATAQLHQLGHLIRVTRCPRSQIHEHRQGIAARQDIQRHLKRCGKIAKEPAAGDDDQASRGPWQQGCDLGAACGVVQDQQGSQAGHPVPPHRCPPVQAGGQVPGIHPVRR